MQAWNLKFCHIKLWIIIKESSVSHAFNIICILIYCGLYRMTIAVVIWRIIKKWCIWSLHLHNFLCLTVFCIFPYKLCPLSLNFFNFIYSYLKLKLGREKHIRLKWVFLPQWHLDMILFRSKMNRSFMALCVTVLCLHTTYYLANDILFIQHYFQIKITNNLQSV